MNFDDALRHYWPTAWFHLKFFKYKYRGRGERELALIRHFIAPGSTALDIGSSIGMYAAEMARYAGKVIAFEANPRVAAFIAEVAPRNVEVINVALSSASGRATLRIPHSKKGKAVGELATIETDNPLYVGAGESVEVDMKRLDDFKVANCSFIKIDVEGHEAAVLDGASGLMNAQRPILMVELDERINPGAMERFTGRLIAHNYQGFFLSRGKLRRIAEFDAAEHQDPKLVMEYTRKSLPADREYINNFIFFPQERAGQMRARL